MRPSWPTDQCGENLSAVVGGIIGALIGGAAGHQIGYDAGYRVGYGAGYNQAKWEMEQQIAAMRAEFADKFTQLQAQVNELARVAINSNQRQDRLEQLIQRLLSTLEEEAQVTR